MKLFITGASGYIGGSFLTKALKLGCQVLCFDNFSNSNIEPIDKLRQEYKFKFYQTDLKDYGQISDLMKDFCPDIVVHFAALKSVTESEIYQSLYTENNVEGTKNLLEAMKENAVSKLIFSSSAAVYGNQFHQPVSESSNIMPISHYAKTKALCERIIKEYCDKYKFNSISLRYFNPLGVHAENIFYDSINNAERNVLGNLMACHLKISPFFKIYGTISVCVPDISQFAWSLSRRHDSNFFVLGQLCRFLHRLLSRYAQPESYPNSTKWFDLITIDLGSQETAVRHGLPQESEPGHIKAKRESYRKPGDGDFSELTAKVKDDFVLKTRN